MHRTRVPHTARSDTAAGIAVRALLPGLALAAAACGAGDGPATTVSDSAGVRLVRSPGVDRPLEATTLETATLEVPDSALTAVPWGVAADPAAGRIYALDWTGERVAVLDREGTFVAWIGRRGDGPGEFRNPSALAVDREGTLHVLDGGRAVVSRWTRSGELVDERRAPASYWGPGLAVSRGGLAYVASSESGMEQRETLVWDRGGERSRLHSLVRELTMMELPCMRRPAAPVLAPSVVWALRGDTAWVRHGPGYRIDVLSGGRTVASYRRRLEPIPVTAAMAEARVGMGPYAGLMRACGVSATEVVDAVGHVESVSPVFWLAADPAGRLWVTRTDDGVRPARVDVLGAGGKYLGTLDLAAIPVAFLSDSAFVAVSLGALGETRLTLYELGAGAGPAPGTAAAPERRSMDP